MTAQILMFPGAEYTQAETQAAFDKFVEADKNWIKYPCPFSAHVRQQAYDKFYRAMVGLA